MNYIAIFVAAIVAMIVGFLWYSPVLFGSYWMKLMEYKKNRKGMQKTYILTFIAAIISASVLRYLIKITGAIGVGGGIKIGFFVWLGFTTTVQFTDWIFSDKKKELYILNTGYQLVSFLIMGVILSIWQ
jgi:hypothetical protein